MGHISCSKVSAAIFTFGQVPIYGIFVTTAAHISLPPSVRGFDVVCINITIIRTYKIAFVSYRLVTTETKFLTSLVDLCKICYYGTSVVDLSNSTLLSFSTKATTHFPFRPTPYFRLNKCWLINFNCRPFTLFLFLEFVLTPTRLGYV